MRYRQVGGQYHVNLLRPVAKAGVSSLMPPAKSRAEHLSSPPDSSAPERVHAANPPFGLLPFAAVPGQGLA
jgi:hypothetical protein